MKLYELTMDQFDNTKIDVSTAKELKDKYFDLFIEDMQNKDHYFIDENSDSIVEYNYLNQENEKITARQLNNDFWHWVNELILYQFHTYFKRG
tara:strand:- start:151 stop:429 length:279 start_codon:yes stop_codon:yes gene_type:complete